MVAEGKIPINGKIKLDDTPLPDAKIYLHIKGYARARVTHIDIEDPAFRKVILPRHSDYPEVDWNKSKVIIPFKGHTMYLTSTTLGKIIKLKGNLYVGGKGKGIFLGFHKEQLIELEKYGCKLGICPKKLEKIS